MTTFFTSDLHSFHKNIVNFTNRKDFTTPESHDDWLINIWNSQVSKGDLVYHLGDFSFGNYEQTVELLSKLNGQKILIKGNHDRSDWFDKIKGKARVVNTHQYLEIKIQGVPVIMFHFPIASWHKQHYGSIHLHGHSHGNFQFKLGKILDVGLDSAFLHTGEHRLFTEKDVVNYMKTREIYITDNHREEKQLESLSRQ